MPSPNSSPVADRAALRRRLLAEREAHAGGGAAAAAVATLTGHLRAVLAQLEPRCLGLYWPHRSEFNAPAALAGSQGHADQPWALPFAQRAPVALHYRLWDGQAPRAVDECGLPASDGDATIPDVVLVPCLGYTDSGFRLGYGGGYFDRWLVLHPDVCAVGVAWSIARLDEAVLAPAAHDVRLALMVTERGVA